MFRKVMLTPVEVGKGCKFYDTGSPEMLFFKSDKFLLNQWCAPSLVQFANIRFFFLSNMYQNKMTKENECSTKFCTIYWANVEQKDLNCMFANWTIDGVQHWFNKILWIRHKWWTHGSILIGLNNLKIHKERPIFGDM